MTMRNHVIPQSWIWTNLGIISEPSKDKANPTEIPTCPYIGLEHIEKGTSKLVSVGTSNEIRSTKSKFNTGDLLYGRLRPYLNKVHVAKFHGICSTDILVYKENPNFDNRFLMFLMLSPEFVRFANLNMSGVQHPRVNHKIIGQYPLPLPPLPEQHRIVSKIEELFTKLDAGVVALKTAKAQLNRYRQAVLKSAFEGKLTEEWRNSTSVKMDPASNILDAIKSNLWKGKKDWHINDKTILPELPENWEWSYVGFIGETITGNTPSKKKTSYYGNEYPFYKPTDLNSGYYVSNSIDGLSSAGMEIARCVQEKSTLVTCIGATIGKTGFVRKKGAFNQQINAILPNKNILPEYTYFICNSPQFQLKIKQKASSTTLPILNKSKFQNLPFPVPPLKEQREIVRRIENQFAFTERIENDISSLFRKCSALNRKILSNAFQGKLVPQDPTDESASKLLERIKADKSR